MNNSRWPYTPTLARLHASQGHYEQAAEIYARLVADSPGDKALSDEFDAFQQKRRQAESEVGGQLPELFGRWIELLVRARFFASQARSE